MEDKKTKKPAVKKAPVKKTPVKKVTAPKSDIACPHCGQTITPDDLKNASTKKKPSSKVAVTPKVLLKTNMGEIELEFYPDKAPATVQNFLDYVNAKHYDGLVFHRVIKGFMVQGGGMNASMQEKSTRAPIKIESDNGLRNLRGTIAMARTMDPNSATSQFFINHADNSFLDFRSADVSGWGYTVFGKVTKGIEIVDKIANIPTGTRGHFQDVPKETVTIESAKEIK